MKKNRSKIVGCSYAFRVEDIWPKYHICEKTFYNIINASADPKVIRCQEEMRSQLSLF